jgi:transposase
VAMFRVPDPQMDGVSARTRPDLCWWLHLHFSKTCHPSSLTRVLRCIGLSWQKRRPVHPQADDRPQQRFKKSGCAAR